MSYFTETMTNLLHQTAFFNLEVGNFIMIVVACVFLYLAIAKGFEPLLLVPIAFGMLLVNIYPDIFATPEQMSNGVGAGATLQRGAGLSLQWLLVAEHGL